MKEPGVTWTEQWEIPMADVLAIRRYRDEDHDAVWVLHHMAEGTLTVYDIPPAAADDPHYGDFHRIDEVYLRTGGEFFVGIHEGQVVAIGALQRTSAAHAEIKRMRVHRDYQRRGFGRAILAALERQAIQLGYTTLHLDTTADREPAQRLYLSAGYHEIGRSVNLIFYEKHVDRSPMAVAVPDTS